MEKDKYSESLKSGIASEIRKAIDSDYNPSTEQEIDLLSNIARWRNSYFHQKLLEIAKRIDRELALPLFSALAQFAIKDEIRNAAIDDILQVEHPQRGKVLLECINDQLPAIQQKVLKGIQGWKNAKAISLLLDRFNNPTAALAPEQLGEEDNIRGASIEGLKMQGASTVIEPIIKYWVQNHPMHRDKIVDTLITIDGKQVIEKLLDEIDGETEANEAMPDDSFKVDAAVVISQIETTQLPSSMKERYQSLLEDIYPYVLQHQTGDWKRIVNEAPKNLNETLPDTIISEFKKNKEQNIATDIINSFNQINVLDAYNFWIEVFDELLPHYKDVAVNQLVDVGKRDINEFISFLKAALCDPGNRHNPDALPEVVMQLSDQFSTQLVRSLVPLFDQDSCQQYLRTYFWSIWTGTSSTNIRELIITLLTSEYKTEYAFEEIGALLANHWNEPFEDDNDPSIVLDVIIGTWKKTQGNQKKRIEEVVVHISKHAGNNARWFTEIAKRAPTSPRSNDWIIINKAITHVPEEHIVSISIENLNHSWNQKFTELIIERDKEKALPILRNYLDQVSEGTVTKSQRKWIIKRIGKCGTPSDFDLLNKEIEGDSVDYAVKAVKAIGSIDVNKGQAILREAMRSRKLGVVKATINELKNVTEIELETITSLHERTRDKDEEIKHNATKIIGNLRDRHIMAKPSVEEDTENLQKWLHILGAFGPHKKSGKAFNELLSSLGEREEPQKRLVFANAVSRCCPTELGIEIAEKEIGVERKPDVVNAWENALDELKGTPDRSIFRLVSEVCDDDLNQKEILGQGNLGDLFFDPDITLPTLRDRLRRANRVKTDPDTLVTNLDGTAELLIDEILLASGEDLQKFGNNYANKIGKTKSIVLRAHHVASTLHGIRESAIDPHAKDSTGAPRTGVTMDEAEDAKKSFVKLFEETIKFLVSKK